MTKIKYKIGDVYFVKEPYDIDLLPNSQETKTCIGDSVTISNIEVETDGIWITIKYSKEYHDIGRTFMRNRFKEILFNKHFHNLEKMRKNKLNTIL